MCYGISWLDSRGPRGGSFEASWGPFWGLSGPVPVMHVGYEGRAWILGAWVACQKLHASSGTT